MSENNNVEVFTAEYRHLVVEKFVKDLIEGFVQSPILSDLESDAGKTVMQRYFELQRNIEKYASGKLKHDELDKVEAEIFSEITTMRIVGYALNRKPDFQIKEEIERIEKKINSTNKLLFNVLVMLDLLMKKIDK